MMLVKSKRKTFSMDTKFLLREDFIKTRFSLKRFAIDVSPFFACEKVGARAYLEVESYLQGLLLVELLVGEDVRPGDEDFGREDAAVEERLALHEGFGDGAAKT